MTIVNIAVAGTVIASAVCFSASAVAGLAVLGWTLATRLRRRGDELQPVTGDDLVRALTCAACGTGRGDCICTIHCKPGCPAEWTTVLLPAARCAQ